MASRRSHAPSHNITSISTRYKITYYSRVPRGHVYIRNPLQAAKQRSCGISIPSPSLGSAKRDRPSSSTSYGMRQSPFGELYGWRCRTYPQLRCFAACSGFHYYRSRSAEPAAHTICIIFLSKDPVFPSKHEKRVSQFYIAKPFLIMSMLCGDAAYILSSYYLTTTLRVVPSESLRMLMPLTGAEISEPSAA